MVSCLTAVWVLNVLEGLEEKPVNDGSDLKSHLFRRSCRDRLEVQISANNTRIGKIPGAEHCRVKLTSRNSRTSGVEDNI